MNEYIQHRQGCQARRMNEGRRRMAEDDLCLRRLLPIEQIEAAIQRHSVAFRERLYTPLVTIWTFLHQVLAADQSCRAAVAHLLAFVCVGGDRPSSAKTDPYCKARQRLPEAVLADLARQSGEQLHATVSPPTLLGGRPIKIADGTTVSMPDTAANQAAYPQQPGQKAGLGFPILRLVGLISLSCGAVLDVAMARYRGKQTGETALLRRLLDRLEAGDVLLADAMFSNYWIVVMLQRRGVDLLSRHDGKRKLDFRSGRRQGRYDHVVRWYKPKRPSWLDLDLYRLLPESVSIRELKVDVRQKGFRCRSLSLVTTLVDSEQYRRTDLATAFRARWQAELDLRSIKHVMQMDVLRCKSPAMVRKEIWMHLLAYNLVRKLMAHAAAEAQVCPRDLSFKGTLQTVVAFSAWGRSCPDRTDPCYLAVLQAVATHRVNNRPDRIEPRAVKRRPKKGAYLTEPRLIARARLLNGN